jgi:hypothetical protein
MAVMAKQPRKDRHKLKTRSLRLRDDMWEALDALAEQLGTDSTHEIRNAIRERLKAHDCWPWPPPPPADAPSEDS